MYKQNVHQWFSITELAQYNFIYEVLMAMKMLMVVFHVVMPCDLVVVTCTLEKRVASICRLSMMGGQGMCIEFW
jgi:hypothetical protein